eukprot:scaffold248764_cov43-Prasinocladus_malaysianus.AAC.3
MNISIILAALTLHLQLRTTDSRLSEPQHEAPAEALDLLYFTSFYSGQLRHLHHPGRGGPTLSAPPEAPHCLCPLYAASQTRQSCH